MKNEEKKYKRPLERKILFGCAIFSIFLCVLLGTLGAVIYSNGMIARYEAYMEGILKYAMTEIDGDDLESCIESGEKSEIYEKTQSVLDQIKENYDIEYIYIVKPLNEESDDNMMNVMAGTTVYEKEYEKDTLVELGEYTEDAYSSEVVANYLQGMDMENGEILYFRNKTEFGYDYTGLVPIFNSEGNSIAILAVDISVNEIGRVLLRYLIIVLIGMVLLLSIFLTGLYRWIRKRVITPIFKIQESAEQFVESSRGKKDPDEIIYEDPDIHSEDEVQALSESLVTMATDLKRYMKDLMKETREKERIGAELQVATQIQSSMLPCIFPPFPERDEFDIYATMTPAKEVGGDFYDFFMVDERHLAIVMADVSGKGVPAALFMVIGKTLIKDHTQPGRDLGEVFTEVNNILCESNDNGMFITAFEGVLDLETGEFRYVNAGHEMPFIYRKESGYEAYKIRPGFVLAGMENIRYKEQKLQLQEGDKIFQYTDGVTEATDKDNQLYGMNRLAEVLNQKCINSSPQETLEFVKKDIDDFVGENEQFDDITMLCLTFVKKMENEGIAYEGNNITSDN